MAVILCENNFPLQWNIIQHCALTSFKTRNTFYGTWYLPHSRVHKSIAELCGNFGDSAITKRQIVYFSLRSYFYFLSKSDVTIVFADADFL